MGGIINSTQIISFNPSSSIEKKILKNCGLASKRHKERHKIEKLTEILLSSNLQTVTDSLYMYEQNG